MPGASNELHNDEKVVRLERELSLIKQALTRLGLKACSQCGTFFARSDTGALFGSREPVCLDCVQQWWPQRCEQLSGRDRDLTERRLVTWLMQHHGCTMLKLPERPIDSERFHMIANCQRCDRAGKLAGSRCGSCDGKGRICLVVPEDRIRKLRSS